MKMGSGAEYLHQKQLLLDEQARQAKLLQTTGVAERARKSLSESRQVLIGQLPTRLVVQRFHMLFEGEDKVSRLAQVCFISSGFDAWQQIKNISSPVTVSEIYDDVQLAGAEFNNDDAALVESLVVSLERMRDAGRLPDLDASCTGIFNPHQALGKYIAPKQQD